MMERSSIVVQFVTNGLQRKIIQRFTAEDTLENTCILVANVRRVFHLLVPCVVIITFIQVNTNAQNVASVVIVVKIWQYTGEVIQERNRLNVLFVANDSQHLVTLLNTAEFTAERNRTNVTCVTRRLVSLDI